jgi:thiamine-phosphate pyrophosphorylase
MDFLFTKLYPILDSSYIPQTDRAEYLHRLGSSLSDAGVTLLEYRNKQGSDEELVADASILRKALPTGMIKLILDDRADLVECTGFDGVHVDAGDTSPADARALLGPEAIIGTFGGGEALLPGILSAPASYLSIGPVFPTRTKQTANRPIGIDGVKRLRDQAGLEPVLVGVAGITLETAAAVIEAGASLVAVSEAIFGAADPAAEVRRWMAALSC